MALKITLKANEKLIIGGAVLTNGGSRTDLIVENSVPILREKEILSEEDAFSPCRRIYLAIQLIYLDEKNPIEHHKTYWELVKDLVHALPSQRVLINEISNSMLKGKYYQALKLTKKLIKYEEEVVSNVRKSTTGCIQESTQNYSSGT